MSLNGLNNHADAEDRGADDQGPFATEFVRHGPDEEACDEGTKRLKTD